MHSILDWCSVKRITIRLAVPMNHESHTIKFRFHFECDGYGSTGHLTGVYRKVRRAGVNSSSIRSRVRLSWGMHAHNSPYHHFCLVFMLPFVVTGGAVVSVLWKRAHDVLERFDEKKLTTKLAKNEEILELCVFLWETVRVQEVHNNDFILKSGTCSIYQSKNCHCY